MVSRRREEFASSETESASREGEFTLEVGERESTSTHFRFVDLGGAGRVVSSSREGRKWRCKRLLTRRSAVSVVLATTSSRRSRSVCNSHLARSMSRLATALADAARVFASSDF